MGSLGKDAAAAAVMAVNGVRREAAGVDPSTTLLEFLRTRTPVRGPKLGCGEGGCGACVVLISKYDPATDEVTEFSASSCLTLVGSLNHCSVTTSEGIGNTRDGYHPVQQRLAGFHASQCGFCTPGMCMSIFSALVKADKPGAASEPAPPPGFSKLTSCEAEHAVSGNLCRCTGYRPIVDACKSFAADVDLEDLGLNSFWKKGADRAGVGKLPEYSSGTVCTFPEFLKSEIKASVDQQTNNVPAAIAGEDGWYHPRSIQELHTLFDSNWFDGNSVKIVASNTGAGVYKDQDLYEKYIDIKGIPELSVINRSSKGVEIGAAVSISKAIEVFSDGTPVFRKISSHLSKVASPFVRNTATVGGNLLMAQRLQFPSDIATVLLAAGSTVTIQTASKMLCLTLEEFLEQPPCDAKTILLSIFVPDWGSDNVIFETSRAAPRPFGNAVSYVNSAFLAKTSGHAASGELIIDEICLAFGAYGVDHATRARKVEEFLKGKSVSASVILEAVRLLKDVISPSEGTTYPEYRVSLAVSFLFSFLSSLATDLNGPAKAIIPNGLSTNRTMNGNGASSLEKQCKVASDDLPIRSRQELVFTEEYKPVGKPTTKAGAELQASGEAVYVDDIPAPKDCLYGAFIYSTHPHAHIKGVNFKSSVASKKVITVISAKDIPAGGKNIGSSFPGLGDEALFGDPVSEFAGQNVGVVIAETQKYAYMAAKQAVIEYSTEDLEPPILTIEDAIQHDSYFHPPPFLAPKPVGDFEQGMSEADHKILSGEVKLESQYYFYMETQTALAVPDEDNCITVYASTQLPEVTQNVVADCLGIPYHNVRIITRRVGGGFGGKAMKGCHVACACAVAAFKLRRPVRMYLDRKTDMIMAGGRHPMKVKYSVGFKSDGTLTALHLGLGINAGISPDVSPALPSAIVGALKKYNWGALAFDIKVCKTNVSSKSAMRGPGDVQGCFIAEAIIEHVASALAADTNTVRRKNLHCFEGGEEDEEGSGSRGGGGRNSPERRQRGRGDAATGSGELLAIPGVGPRNQRKLVEKGFDGVAPLKQLYRDKFFGKSDDKMVEFLQSSVGIIHKNHAESITLFIKESVDEEVKDTDTSKPCRKKRLTFCVEGNISVGKSTFLQRIANETIELRDLVEIVPEPVAKWQDIGPDHFNILDAFYAEPQRYAYTFQNYVFVTRVMQERESSSGIKPLRLMERSVFSDRMVFVRAVHEAKWMNEMEISIYDSWFDPVVSSLPGLIPDGFIYLRASPDTCHKRMMVRKRSEEGGVSLDYLQGLHEKHESWLLPSKGQGSGLLSVSQLPIHMEGSLHPEIRDRVFFLEGDHMHSSIQKVPALILDCENDIDFNKDIEAKQQYARQVAEFFEFVKKKNEALPAETSDGDKSISPQVMLPGRGDLWFPGGSPLPKSALGSLEFRRAMSSLLPK